ncbi:hypothetical protein [Arthrobacter sp. H5]|uniref:hypothetical protein n=1 Tax=Arthrobacter sp. H5 TaxID=1267973 RepID=UPI0004864824|nr:hypothetical protein [Arthrobacter sp. H5]
MIRISYIYEECGLTPLPGWIVDEEDQRIPRTERFGRPGVAWATIVGAQMEMVSPFLESLYSYFPYFRSHVSEPLSTSLQLRVCSPTFKETDERFLRGGKHLSLIQDEFNIKLVEDYIDRRIQETANRKLSARYEAWEENFHLFDPDDDCAYLN